MENGKVGFMGFLRHRNPILCAQGRLAAYICQRYNLEGVIIPDPNNPEKWNAWALWPASSPSANVTYEQAGLCGLLLLSYNVGWSHSD